MIIFSIKKWYKLWRLPLNPCLRNTFHLPNSSSVIWVQTSLLHNIKKWNDCCICLNLLAFQILVRRSMAFALNANTGIFDTRIEFWLSHSCNSFNIYAGLQSDVIARFSYFLQNTRPGQLVVSPIERGPWYIVVLYALSEACTSPISLLGCCIAVSYASWLILNLTKVVTQGV